VTENQTTDVVALATCTTRFYNTIREYNMSYFFDNFGARDILMAASPYFNFAALMIAVFVSVAGSPVILVISIGIGPNFGIIATIYVGTSVIGVKYKYDMYHKLLMKH